MRFYANNWAKVLPITLGTLILGACSDGSNGTTTPPPPPVNQAPTVSISGDTSLDEKMAGMIAADATDTDGSISTYAWSQTGGTTVTLDDTSLATLNFTAPVAKVEETLTFEVMVTDNEGATASSSVTITVNPVNEIDFQIQGLVWNGAAVPSDVNADYGADAVSVTTDADGNYVIDVLADEDFAESLMFLRSDGSDDPEIAFHNIPLTLQAMMDASGGDGVLDASEELGVNLTPLSTAFYGIMYRANDAVATEADVSAAMATVNGSEAISLGTAVKIISENNGSVTLGLPDGYADTIEFAIDPVGAQQYVSSSRLTDPAAFDGAKDLMMGDENIILASVAPFSEFPTTITMTAQDVVVSRLTVQADGSGIFSEGGSEIDVEWTQDADGLVTITGGGGGAVREVETMPWKQINGIWQQVREINSLERVVLTPLFDMPTGILYDHENVITLSYPDNASDLPDEDASRSFQVTYIEDEEYQDVDVEALFGGGTEATLLTSYFSSNFNPNLGADTNTGFGPRQFHYNADVLTLERVGTDMNGTVTSQFAPDLFSNGSWEAIDTKTIQVTFNSDRFNPGETFEINYNLIHQNLTTVAVYREGVLEGLHNGTFAVDDPANRPQTDMEAEGFYASPFGVNSSQIIWTEIKSDGTAEQITLFDNDRDTILEQTEVRRSTAFWELDMDGTIVISEYRYPGTRAPNCDPNVSTCLDSRRTRLNVMERNQGKVYALNELSIYFTISGDSNNTAEAWYQLTSRALGYSSTAPVDISALPPGP